MKEVLDKGIKDLIDEYPEVGEILTGYDIACVPCSVGTCMLKDVVEIHNLSRDTEKRLMADITEVVFPGEDVEIPQIEREETDSEERSFSPPLKKLVAEHNNILKLVTLIPDILESTDITKDEDKALIENCVKFIKRYADSFHHAKEEDLLFGYTEEELEIIQVMKEEHKQARNLVESLEKALEKEDSDILRESFRSYAELLDEHIEKENEILYPWIDRNLTDHEVGVLYSDFRDVEKNFGEEPERLKDFINDLPTLLSNEKEMIQ